MSKTSGQKDSRFQRDMLKVMIPMVNHVMLTTLLTHSQVNYSI